MLNDYLVSSKPHRCTTEILAKQECTVLIDYETQIVIMTQEREYQNVFIILSKHTLN
jgi:hypothetical protein